MKNQIMCAVVLLAAVLTSSVYAAEWTTPVPVASVINTQYQEWTPYLSYDGLSLYFSRLGQYSYGRIYEARRSQPSGDFTSVSQVLSSSGHLIHPWVSQDNLRMYYYEEASTWRVKVSQRASVNDPWSAGTAVSGIPSGMSFPTLSQDELTMVFNSASGPGGWDMYIATRPDKSSAFGNIRILSELNTASVDGSPSLTPDGLSIYFHSNRTGVQLFYEATRQSINDPFGNPMLLPIDIPNGAVWPDISISGDGKALYFGMGANPDIYVSYNVPEPASIALLGLGIMALRRKRKS